MTSSKMNTKIDVSILRNEMGIEVLDDGSTYLNTGDRLIRRTVSEVIADKVDTRDLQSTDAVTKLLSGYTKTNISFVYDPKRAKTYIAAALREADGYLRLYEVTSSTDTQIIADGVGIHFEGSKRTYTLGTSSQLGTTALHRGELDSVGGFGDTRLSYSAYDLATTNCDSKTNDAEKLQCYDEREQASNGAAELARKRAEIESAKADIRQAILNNTLTADLIERFRLLVQ